MKHLLFIGCLLLVGATVTVSCRKERPASTTGTTQASSTTEKDPAIEMLMQSKTLSFMELYCTPTSGKYCNMRGATCMILNPRATYEGFEQIAVRFYEPVETGQGETGTQMVIVLLGEGHLPQTVLGPQESNQSVIPLNQEVAQHLNCSAIEVINHPCTPVYNTQYPYGYIVLDCIAHH